MKHLLLLPAVILLVSGALLPSAIDSENKADDIVCPYYPLKVGNTWEYKSSGKGVLAKDIVTKVTSIEKIDGLNCARLESTHSPTGVLTEYLAVKEEGVYRIRANDKDITPPELILKMPPKKGESWSIDSAMLNYGIKGKFTSGEEKLTVGDVSYETIRVNSSDMVLGGQNISIDTWYAKNVGMVKRHVKLPAADYDLVVELTKFTAGK